MTFTPRSYQRRAFRLYAAAHAEGKRRILLVSPTGSGKTVMAAHLIATFLRRRPGEPASWFAHRRELIIQAVATLLSFGLEAGYGGRDSANSLQVASIMGALRKGAVPPANFAIFDEAHHMMADEFGLVFDAYGKEVPICGLTATPERSDGRAMGGRFEHIIVAAQNSELVEHWRLTEGREGLVPCEVLRPPQAQRPGYIAKQPVDAYLDAGLRGKRNVVFAPSVSEAERFAAGFEARGVKAHVVHDKLGGDERDRRLQDFRSGKVRVLCNVFILTEGWDCPAVEVITLARRFGSIGPMMQAVGRGRRPYDGKDLCTVLDLAGVTHVLGDPDEDRDYSLDGIGIRRKGVVGASYCQTCGGAMSSDDIVCPTCSRPRDPAEVLKASGDPLEKFARYQRDDDHTRAARLAKFIQREIDDGHNPKRAFFRYKGTYFVMPTSRIISEADAIRRNREWCRECGHHKNDDNSCRCRRVA